jgi:hypothetical protein
MSVCKTFDRSLYESHDTIGRQKTIEFFKERYNVNLIENPDIYGIDLLAFRGSNKVGYVEVEVRNNWSGTKFPFDCLHVPERKEKLLSQDLPTVLVSLNKQCTMAFICGADLILFSPKMERVNKYVSSGEIFFLVNLNRIKLVNLRNKNEE